MERPINSCDVTPELMRDRVREKEKGEREREIGIDGGVGNVAGPGMRAHLEVRVNS